MSSYKTKMLCWNMGGPCKLFDWPDPRGISDVMQYSAGACFMDLHKMSDEEVAMVAIADAWKLVVHFECDPKQVEDVMWEIDEFRLVFRAWLEGRGGFAL